MPQLVKKIEGEIIDNIIGDVNFIGSVYGEIQQEDYINLNNFVAYLQNFSKVTEVKELTKPINFGLENRYNLQTNTIEISY